MEMDYLGVSRLESSRVAPSRSIEQLDATVCINRADGLHLQSHLVVCVMCNCTCTKGACAFTVGTRPAVFTGRGGRGITAGRVPTQKARPGK